jgi:hypothetical protein
MQTISSIIKQLTTYYPQLRFKSSDTFRWDPSTKTIHYTDLDSDSSYLLLHEAGHALLEHNKYSRDIELVAMERDAWQYAKVELARELSLTIPAKIIEDNLDTYRDWLHARSTCPTCSATGIQIQDFKYQCVVCQSTWTVNQATGCQLRRYLKKHP